MQFQVQEVYNINQDSKIMRGQVSGDCKIEGEAAQQVPKYIEGEDAERNPSSNGRISRIRRVCP